MIDLKTLRNFPPPGSPEFRKLAEPLEKYCLSLGKLITAFSGLETNIFVLLGLLAGVPKPIALALFADVRVDQGMNSARRVLAARVQLFGATPREKRLEQSLANVFEQIAIINGIRNHIVHHGISPGDFEKPVASNAVRARSQQHLREIPVPVDDIIDMMNDVAVANIILRWVSIALQKPNSFDEILGHAELAAQERPWRYKPPVQAGGKGKTQNKPPKQQRPPQPSQE